MPVSMWTSVMLVLPLLLLGVVNSSESRWTPCLSCCNPLDTQFWLLLWEDLWWRPRCSLFTCQTLSTLKLKTYLQELEKIGT